MGKFILFIDKLVNLYLYFVVMACFLSIVPNINPNYPLFKFIFTATGFYLIPPIFGFSFSVMLVMVVCALISMGLKKVYLKFYKKNQPEIIVLNEKDFVKSLEKFNKMVEQEKLKEVDNNDNDNS